MALRRGIAAPNQEIGNNRQIAFPAECMGQQGRLIEPPPQQAPAMQRHGDDPIRLGQEINPRPRQP